MQIKLMFLISLAILCSFFAESQQDCSMHRVKIVCTNILNFGWPDLGFIPTCLAEDSMNTIIPGSSVSSVVHINGSEVRNLLEIEGFQTYRGMVKFIPTGIMRKFTNLKVLVIYETGLLSVTKDNLREFGSSLEKLSLSKNKLIFIDADLFVFNPNLKDIWITNNPIRHIEPGFFANLKNLEYVNFLTLGSAGCMSQTFDAERGDNIDTFEWSSENCSDESARSETQSLIDDALCWEAQVLRIPDKIIENANEINEASIARSEELERNLNTRIDSLEKKMESVLKIVTQIKCLSNNQKRK